MELPTSLHARTLHLLLFILYTFYGPITPRKAPDDVPFIRWCVLSAEAEKLCWKMAATFQRPQGPQLLNVACVRGGNVYQCMRLIQNNIADAINLNAEHIYIAGKQFRLKLLFFEKLVDFNGRHTDDAVVVIRRDQDFKRGLADLRGKSICISGSSPNNLQYQALLNVLFPLGYMKVQSGQCQSPIPSIKAHFGRSCVPGSWSLNKTSHRAYARLCRACHSVCTDQDYYAGADGVIRCLKANAAHIGITSSKALDESPLDPNKFERLSLQGVRRPLDDTSSWLGRRPNAVVISPKIPKNQTSQWLKALTAVFQKYRSKPADSVPWLRKILFSDDIISDLIDPLGKDTFDTYLGQVFTRSMETPFPKLDCGVPRPLVWCVVHRHHLQKCQETAAAFSTRRLRPQIACVQARTRDQCTLLLAHNKAHVTILPPVEAVAAQRDFHLTPIAVESTRSIDISSSAAKSIAPTSRYLVAVAKKSSNVTFGNLFGATSCHSGVSDILGYNGPPIILSRRKLLHLSHCNFPLAISSMFWQSCVPGLQKSLLADHGLCAVCENSTCSSLSQGATSAIQCLKRRGGGDITFVTSDNLDQLEPTNKFELLCLDRSKRPISDYERCHWLKLPPPVIVMSSKHFSDFERKQFTQLLADASYFFVAKKATDAGHFSIFSTENDPNSLFDNSTRSLKPIWPGKRSFQNLEEALGADFVGIYRKILDCNGSDNNFNFNIFGCLTIVSVCLIVVTVIFQI